MIELPRVTIAGDGVVLRDLHDDDADEVAAACSDPVISGFLPTVPIPYTRDDALFWIQKIAPDTRARGGATFIVADPATGRLIGSISANGARLGGRQTSVGYWVAPWARGHGVAADATRTLVPWLFEHGFGRIELTTRLDNVASQRTALAAGFRHEGIRRAAGATRDGAWCDIAVWTRLVTDSGEPVQPALPDPPSGGLTDGVVTLRRLGHGDVDDLHAVHTLADVIATAVRPVPTREDTARRCANAAYAWLTGTRAEFAICDAATGALAGDIGLFHLDPIGQGMIGYSLGTAWRGRGYAARAARLVADWAFDQVGLVRVVAGTAPSNIASQRTLERAGFQREGYERDRLPGPDGTRVDDIAFALLRSDRPAR